MLIIQAFFLLDKVKNNMSKVNLTEELMEHAKYQ